MPLYDLVCKCGYKEERLLGMDETLPECPECKVPMAREWNAPPMVKIPGEGGYPSRRRQVFNTTNRIHPKLD